MILTAKRIIYCFYSAKFTVAMLTVRNPQQKEYFLRDNFETVLTSIDSVLNKINKRKLRENTQQFLTQVFTLLCPLRRQKLNRPCGLNP